MYGSKERADRESSYQTFRMGLFAEQEDGLKTIAVVESVLRRFSH